MRYIAKLFIPFSLLLTSCVNHYVIPSGSSTTKMLFSTTQQIHADIFTFEEPAEDCKNERYIGSIHNYAISNEPSVATTISTDKVFVAHMRQTGTYSNGVTLGSTYCAITFRFTPVASAEYIADVGVCKIKVFRIDANAVNGKVEEPTFARSSKQCNW